MITTLVFDAYGTLYDPQSVAVASERAFPGHGEYITQVWRLKQLEYTWLRSLMGHYVDFWTVTRESLGYTLDTIGLASDDRVLDELAEHYNRLAPYPEAKAALAALDGYRLAILSNGSPAMLDALVASSGLGRFLETIMSVDPKRAYKPDPHVYEIVEETLGVPRDEVLFVSSNGFDIAGAGSFGFKVARIARVPAAALRDELSRAGTIGPATMFKALRSQEEVLGAQADAVIGSLRELPAVAETWNET